MITYGVSPIKSSRSYSLFLAVSLFLIAFASISAEQVYAAVIQTQYATIHYEDEEYLQELNEQLYLPRQLSKRLRGKKIRTVQDEVGAKVDILIEKVQQVLQMFVSDLKFDLFVFASAKGAQKALYKKYGRKVNFISFFSRRDNILYMSARDATLRVVAHEFGHVVVEHYFSRSPPVNMHEVMAQYAESHITD